MGLDMYLSKKTYVQNWAHNKPEQHHEVSVKRGGVIREDIQPQRITYVEEQIAYWRKFNALHGWFIDNCANGVDDCKDVHVEMHKLEALLVLLKKINSNRETAADLLPPTQGFFFGSDEIDEWFWKDVESTIEMLEIELAIEDIPGTYSGDYYYRASW